MTKYDVVIVGAGQAGYSTASILRKQGYEGSIKLLGNEKFPPYQRPPLSKKYLLGQMKPERLLLRKEQFYSENAIDFESGSSVESIDLESRQLHTSSGSLSFENAVLATGSSPLSLPASMGGELEGVYSIRSIVDIDNIRRNLSSIKNLLIIGGGYIGLEAAAVFRQLDVKVTIIVGIGATPNSQLAKDSGLSCDQTSQGILVDGQCRTSHSNVWAAGDCAAFKFRDSVIRLESVQNATDQAANVAQNIIGLANGQQSAYAPLPWFWSDQYDVKLQIAGLNMGYTTVIQRAGPKPGSTSFWYFKETKLIAVDAINDATAFMTARKLLEQKTKVQPTTLQNPDLEIKSLLQN